MKKPKTEIQIRRATADDKVGAQNALVVRNPAVAALFEAALTKQSAVKIAVGSEWAWLATAGARFKHSTIGLGDTIEATILDATRENRLYPPDDFDSQNIVPPICYAIGDDATQLAPPADLATKVSERCNGCRMLAWGSGKRGSKACKERVRLILLLGDKTARLSVPVMSAPVFGAYRDELAATGNALFAVLTQLRLESSDRGGFGITFRALGEHPDEALPELERLRLAGQTALYESPGAGFESGEAPKQLGGKRRAVSSVRK